MKKTISQKKKSRDGLKAFLVYFLLILITGILLLPFFWMISTSLKPANEIFSPEPNFLPQKPTFGNYLMMWRDTLFPSYLKNTLIVSLLTVLITMIVALPAAYSISRFEFRENCPFHLG